EVDIAPDDLREEVIRLAVIAFAVPQRVVAVETDKLQHAINPFVRAGIETDAESRPMIGARPHRMATPARTLRSTAESPDDHALHSPRWHPQRHAQRARLRGMPVIRRRMAAPAHLPHLRACRLLRRLAEPARHRAFP